MKKFILMTLGAATALSPMMLHAADAVPQTARASATIGAAADFERGERGDGNRAERNRGERNRGERGRGEARGEGQRGEGQRVERAPDAPRVNVRAQRQNATTQVQRRDASHDGRYYDRNRDGNLDRRWDRNGDDRLDRNWDRNRDGRLDRRYDRNDDERLDRRLDRNRNGDLDRRVDRNNDNRVDRNRNGSYDQRYRSDDNGWSTGWRNDRRYDWYGHRQRYSNYYQPGRYYSPYRGHNYSRISIGFSLGSGYYGSRYWINDPGYYRLPPSYGSYRWVRYYDDVLLVDLRSGRVVDVIRDFFW